MLFTRILTGWAAAIYFIAFLALHLYIGIGLLRLRLNARIVGIGYYCFMLVSTASFYLALDRVRLGNLGKNRSVGEAVYELKINYSSARKRQEYYPDGLCSQWSSETCRQ